MTIDTTRLRADAEAVRDAGVTLHTASNRVAKLREDVGPSQLLTDAHREHRGAAEALRGAQKRLYADAPPDGIILALLDEVERLRARRVGDADARAHGPEDGMTDAQRLALILAILRAAVASGDARARVLADVEEVARG